MIRQAGVADADAIYQLGCRIPELQVSTKAPFMGVDELRAALASERDVFLVDNCEGEITGFVYAAIGDLDRGGDRAQACLVYLAISTSWRRRGVASVLWSHCSSLLVASGVRHVYAWAHPTSGVIDLLQRNGFIRGHECVWMDCWLPVNAPQQGRQHGAPACINGNPGPLVGERAHGDRAAVAEHIFANEKPAVGVFPDGTVPENHPIIKREEEGERRISGRPWNRQDRIEILLGNGWRPTRWEREDTGSVLEYPLAGGMRLASSDGTVHELSPDGVLTLHGVKGVVLIDSSADNAPTGGGGDRGSK